MVGGLECRAGEVRGITHNPATATTLIKAAKPVCGHQIITNPASAGLMAASEYDDSGSYDGSGAFGRRQRKSKRKQEWISPLRSAAAGKALVDRR